MSNFPIGLAYLHLQKWLQKTISCTYFVLLKLKMTRLIALDLLFTRCQARLHFDLTQIFEAFFLQFHGFARDQYGKYFGIYRMPIRILRWRYTVKLVIVHKNDGNQQQYKQHRDIRPTHKMSKLPKTTGHVLGNVEPPTQVQGKYIFILFC